MVISLEVLKMDNNFIDYKPRGRRVMKIFESLRGSRNVFKTFGGTRYYFAQKFQKTFVMIDKPNIKPFSYLSFEYILSLSRKAQAEETSRHTTLRIESTANI